MSGVREPCSRDFRTCIFGQIRPLRPGSWRRAGDFRREHYDDPSVLSIAISGITPADQGAMAEAARRWDSIAKPIGGLGLLEEAVIPGPPECPGDRGCQSGQKGAGRLLRR